MPSTPALNRTLNFDNFFGTIEQSKNKIGTDSKLVSLLLYYQELLCQQFLILNMTFLNSVNLK